jgi:hypothetical protein
MATLYAQPTKEWVIPAKPKPGRKPKRDEPVGEEEGGVSDLNSLRSLIVALCHGVYCVWDRGTDQPNEIRRSPPSG